MIRNIVIFGGVWAATATSVALVRRPQTEESLEDGEVETLDPKDFASREGEDDPFATRYSSYFASTKEVNKKFWEDRFSEKSKDKGKIEVNKRSGPKLEIISAWDEPEEKEEGKLSLVGFCKKGYSSKFAFNNLDEWNFSHTENASLDLDLANVWSLCSVFGSKPETLCDNDDDKGRALYSSSTIGHETHKSLVRADVSHVFWDIREQEWQITDVRDSEYFGNKKKNKHTIKDLCKEAYEKQASNVDNEYRPSSETAAKYCRLEWTWN